MTLFPGSIHGGMSQLGAAAKVAAAAAPWYLSGGIAAGKCVAAYQPKGAASLADSYVNLANPGTYNAAPGTAPTWDATSGWKFLTASSQYLTTGITPTKTWSAVMRASDIIKGDYWAFGNYASTGWGIQPYFGVSTHYYNGEVRYVMASRTSGVWGLIGNQGYYNGAADGATIGTGATPAAAIFIGDISGPYRRYFTGYIQAFSIYDTTLTAGQVAALTTAMAAL